jgi:tryptophanyl-tRNA synthetase
MSKSYDNTIEIFCEEKALKEKIARIVTDATPVEAPKNPDTCNLFINICLFLEESEKAALAERYRRGGLKYSDVKKDLFARIWEYFREARANRKELEKDLDGVRRILMHGAEKARATAIPTLELVRKRAGLSY